MIDFNESQDGVTFGVRVHPRAKKTGIAGVHDNTLKISLNSPPTDGRANAALIELIAETLGVARSRVTILAGAQSRNKTVRVSGKTAAIVSEKLAAAIANN